ncbi:MAG: N-acetylornithine carbamoyltransferase [Ichthyobacteriaceae bacterium]|nr:N-acetylornithine carbamoyltransferase [Ichthyobacteriaceae bacterium]
MKHYTSIQDIKNLDELVQEAIELKKAPFEHKHLGENKTLGMIFYNPSLRTRLSTQRAGFNLGMNVIVMNIGSDGWALEFEDGAVMNEGKAEHIKEAAEVISQYCDIIAIRTFPELKDRELDYSEPVISAFKKYATKPIVSMESATGHPLQALADLITIEEHKIVAKPKVVLTWAPHPRTLPQAVPNSFVEYMKNSNKVDLVVTCPEGYELNPEVMEGVTVEHNQQKAFEGADFIYAKNWSSYENYGQAGDVDYSWIVDEAKMKNTNNGKFMHCLPVRRNVVVADDVMDNKERNITIAEANNRTYSAQVVLKNILENS